VEHLFVMGVWLAVEATTSTTAPPVERVAGDHPGTTFLLVAGALLFAVILMASLVVRTRTGSKKGGG
jgi:hypothetical protein